MDILRERLQLLIEERDLAKSRVSVDSGLDDSSIRKILTGKTRNPRCDTVVAISKFLGCPVGYLLGETNVPEYSEVDTQALEALLEKILSVKKRHTPKQIAKWVAHKYEKEAKKARRLQSEEEMIEEEIKQLEQQDNPAPILHK